MQLNFLINVFPAAVFITKYEDFFIETIIGPKDEYMMWRALCDGRVAVFYLMDVPVH